MAFRGQVPGLRQGQVFSLCNVSDFEEHFDMYFTCRSLDLSKSVPIAFSTHNQDCVPLTAM